jgi:hypothetical protein
MRYALEVIGRRKISASELDCCKVYREIIEKFHLSSNVLYVQMMFLIKRARRTEHFEMRQNVVKYLKCQES